MIKEWNPLVICMATMMLILATITVPADYYTPDRIRLDAIISAWHR